MFPHKIQWKSTIIKSPFLCLWGNKQGEDCLFQGLSPHVALDSKPLLLVGVLASVKGLQSFPPSMFCSFIKVFLLSNYILSIKLETAASGEGPNCCHLHLMDAGLFSPEPLSFQTAGRDLEKVQLEGRLTSKETLERLGAPSGLL